MRIVVHATEQLIPGTLQSPPQTKKHFGGGTIDSRFDSLNKAPINFGQVRKLVLRQLGFNPQLMDIESQAFCYRHTLESGVEV